MNNIFIRLASTTRPRTSTVARESIGEEHYIFRSFSRPLFINIYIIPRDAIFLQLLEGFQ